MDKRIGFPNMQRMVLLTAAGLCSGLLLCSQTRAAEKAPAEGSRGQKKGRVVNLQTRYYPSYNKIRLDIATPQRKPSGGYRAPKAASGQALFLGPNHFKTPDGDTGLRAAYYDNRKMEGDPVVERTEGFPTLDKDFARKKVGPDNYAISWRGTYGPVPESGVYELGTLSDDGVRAWVDYEQLIGDWKPHAPEANSGTIRLEKGQTVDFRLDYFEKGGDELLWAEWGPRLKKTTDGDQDIEEVYPLTLKLTDDQGKTVKRRTFDFRYTPEGKRVYFKVGDLEDGRYTLIVRSQNANQQVKEPIYRKHFLWEGNRLGITNKVYPPFKPVQRDEDIVSVVMRDYQQRGIGLWTSAKARGNGDESPMQEILAGPASIKINDGTVLEGEGRFVNQNKQRLTYKGKAAHPAVNVNTSCTTHYDGTMKVKMTLKPGEKNEKLQKLWLDIPVRREQAPLFHSVMIGNIRENPAGQIPEGTGRVWDSRDLRAPHYYGNFHPYLWVGAEERGMAWFADNDRNWELNVDPDNPENSAPCQELLRRDDKVVMRINLIQKPVTLTKPREIVFGLMATPGKPMPDNWRKVLYRNNVKGAEFIHWMAAQYWGSPSVMYSKLPVDGDTSVLSKLQEMRLGGGGTGAFMKAWSKKHLQGDISHKAGKSKKKIEGLLDHAFGISSRADDYLTVYWEEFHATTLFHPEREAFADEWMKSTHSYPESYLNFAAWCGAEFIRRGMGLYFDNAFPKPTYDRLTTAAYKLPNGKIQPSANMWRHRRYFQRIWVLHQQLAPAEGKPIMMLHMTNSHIAPYMVYNMANLDHEWKYGKATAQSKYAPELLRAESVGLQSGNIPTSLATRGSSSHRTTFGVMMVHEIRARFKGDGQKLLKKLFNFGYADEDAHVYNYWDDNPRLEINDSQCKWLLVKHHGELMLLLCTWNSEQKQVTVTLKQGLLNAKPEETRNVEDDTTFKLEERSFDFTMPGHGIRMFRIK